MSAEQATLQFNIGNSATLSLWLKLYQNYGIVGLTPRQKGRKPMKKAQKTVDKDLSEQARLKQLEDENLRLRAENAYLKKLRELRLAKEKKH